ncbi:holin-associated N-acetylmuramidase [Paracoccus pacificus]|uniref:Holin-associated N-acetylmuramidase n=1 Tax=Paracoccus pacificus TaxID=1463598 RepID=A0ABW4R777_9RHOB
MQTIDQIAAEIVGREGGYVNDPDDPGGATKYGVTIGTMRRLGIDVTGDGRVDAADVKALSRTQAQQIFVQHYFKAPGLDRLPEPLQPSVFDMYVNAGANAVKILQRLLVRMGFDLDDDGILGPVTAARAHDAMAVAPNHLVDAYGIERRNYYYALGDARAASRKYARSGGGGKGGWITRAEAFIAQKYHLTLAQHRERVSKWV